MQGAVPAVLAKLAQHGVSVNWRDGKVVLKAATAPPADIVELIEARKADISSFIHPEAVQRRLDAEAEALRAPRPPDVDDDRWATALLGLRAFLAAGYGDEAERLGWSKDELYAVPPLWVRGDLTGVGLAIGDRSVTEVTAEVITIVTSSGAVQRFYRRPTINYAVAYRARIKMVGEDASKEEFQLRAVEAVTNLFRTNHPSADIDTARAAVLDAIKGETR